MLKVITEDIWNNVAIKANGHKKQIAVAFVTDLGKLKLVKNDVLICDASDGNVSAGVVGRDILAKLHEKGVVVIHCANLHAKCARFGRGMRYTLIGSSNLSQNSSETLEEIALMTNDPLVGARVDVQFHAWRKSGIEVDEDFLKRIMKLPLVKRFWGKKRKTARRAKKKEFGTRIWVVGSSPDDYTEEEQREFDVGDFKDQAMNNRESYKVARSSALQALIWWGRCRFTREVKIGDLIAEICDREVSIQVALAVKRRGEKVFCYKAPVYGFRSRSFKAFNMALGISQRNPLYKDGCSRLLLKKHIPMLGKLWKNVDWESLQ